MRDGLEQVFGSALYSRYIKFAKKGLIHTSDFSTLKRHT